jgi:hypothetical protein
LQSPESSGAFGRIILGAYFTRGLARSSLIWTSQRPPLGRVKGAVNGYTILGVRLLMDHASLMMMILAQNKVSIAMTRIVYIGEPFPP